MPDHLIIDTMPSFWRWWATVADEPVAVRAERWHGEYLAAAPELRDLLLADYANQGQDWRELAAGHTFADLPTLLPDMQTACAALPAAAEAAVEAAAAHLGLDFDVASVFYVGLGYAGWATHYADRPAVLYGLEGLAENHWITAEALLGMGAHELGHLVHHEWRRRAGQPLFDGPWSYLYDEGFAMVCEQLATGADTWHMARSQPGWTEWCREHRAWLAQEYLRTAAEGTPVNPFFGSWYDLAGWRQTGYWLGAEMVRYWLAGSDLRALAVLPPERIEQDAMETLSWFGSA